MGKAKQQLLAARESYYETNQEIELDDEEENDKEYIEEEKEYYLLGYKNNKLVIYLRDIKIGLVIL